MKLVRKYLSKVNNKDTRVIYSDVIYPQISFLLTLNRYLPNIKDLE